MPLSKRQIEQRLRELREAPATPATRQEIDALLEQLRKPSHLQAETREGNR